MTEHKIVISVELSDEYVERLKSACPEVPIVVCSDPDQLGDELNEATGLIIGSKFSPELLNAAPRLKWLHSFSAGVSTLLTPELVQSPVIFTNNSGVRSNNVAEHVVAMILAFARGLPVLVRNQASRRWEYIDHEFFEIRGQTLGIVGLGSIGLSLAEKAKGLGMRVLATKRSPADVPDCVDELYGPVQLEGMLGESDHVVICLPLTQLTHHLFGEPLFDAMKRSAFLYNIGRGPIVDHDALVAALQQGQIAGAGLDVTEPEPLPEESPLWDMENVLITAHTAQATPFNWDRSIEIVAQNIQRLAAGETLMNQVDKQAGY